jgi:hypothetical protein
MSLNTSLDDAVILHALTYLDESGEVVIGRTDIDSYGIFPPEGAALLRRLAAGVPVGSAAKWYAHRYGEQVDIADFLDTLDELQFVVKDGEKAEIGRLPLRWQRLGRWAFSPLAWACYVSLLAGAIAAMAAHPRLIPHTGNLYFTQYLSLLALALAFGQTPLILLHEGFHMLAGRRLGLRSSMRLGRRLYFLTFETTIDGLVAVPRRQRYLPMLAGMLVDLLVIATLTLIAYATMGPGARVSPVGAVCLAQAYVTLLRFFWQFYFYLRTDVYYMVVTVLGCVNLQAAARLIMKNRLRRLRRRPLAAESDLHPRDLAIGRWYSWLIPIGYAFSLCTLALTVIPPSVRLLTQAVSRLTHHDQPWLRIIDSVIFLSLSLMQFAITAILIARSRRASLGGR